MVDKLKEAALILKAKITKDEVEQLLLEATSEDNWQTSTTILHGLADAAYNYEQWQKISSFIWEKLKSKKWKKIIKTLNLIEFLLKNGPPSIISTYKYDVYQFKSFDGYNCYDEGVDRGEAIRQKAKAIVELLSNEELLEEERVKAKNIRERLAGSSSEAAYSGYGSGSKYGGTSYKNEGGSKYAGQGSSSKGSTYTSYSTGSYDEGKSTLDKYKNYTGGSLYSKENLNKDKKEKEEQKQQVEKKEEEAPAPEAFKKQAPTLKKPGEVKIQPPPATTTTTTTTNTNKAQTKAPVPQPQAQQKKQPDSGIDIFEFDDGPKVQEAPKPTPPPPQTPIQAPVQQPVQPQQTHPLVNPMLATTSQLAGLNLTGAPTYQNPPTNQPLFNPTGQTYPAHVNPMYPTTAPMAFQLQTPQVQPTYPAHVNPMYPTTAPLAFSQQTHPLVNPMYGTTAPLAANTMQHAQTKPQSASLYTMNTGVSKPVSQPKQEDEFGGFVSSNKDEIKWLSKDETSLIDLNDFSKDMLEKKKEQSTKTTQIKKKESNEGGLLATAEDFENFLSGPTAPQQSYNISMNINNINFGMPNQPQQRPVVDPLLHVGNVMGGMQYPYGGQGYPMNQMGGQQYPQYMQQQQPYFRQ